MNIKFEKNDDDDDKNKSNSESTPPNPNHTILISKTFALAGVSHFLHFKAHGEKGHRTGVPVQGFTS